MTDSFSDILCLPQAMANCLPLPPPPFFFFSPGFESLMTSPGGLPPVLQVLFRRDCFLHQGSLWGGSTLSRVSQS